MSVPQNFGMLSKILCRLCKQSGITLREMVVDLHSDQITSKTRGERREKV